MKGKPTTGVKILHVISDIVMKKRETIKREAEDR